MIADLLNAPAPLTAADAVAMCLVSAAVGAALIVIVLIAWIKIRLWIEDRQVDRALRTNRTILHRI